MSATWPPRLAFDAEGRLVALDVAVPGAIDAEVSFVDAGNEDNSYSPWLALEHDLLDYRGEPLIPRDDTAVEDCD